MISRVAPNSWPDKIFRLPKSSTAQPLETDDEYEIVRGINQKGDQAFVMLAEM